MNRTIRTTALAMLLAGLAMTAQVLAETPDEHNARMQWWREARFGLFIHWGLYAVPAGEWDGKTEYGEWIRTSARIPLSTYDRFVGQFNPTSFDASAWVRMAKDAGMKYIVITSKHHDGFCLFDSKETDFDVMSTPFRRDIMKELSEACRKEGLTMCWYHSIMDWHHPDYLPRREWEKDRPTQGADFDRYVGYMKRQLRELLTNYGEIGVLWFDGEWESTWNTARGKDLYEYVRGLQPQIIVNNRVGAARSGMEGLTKEGEFGGDFGTPEQQIPATGLPGVDWETCMTMNDHWGYNRADQNWKSSKELVRMLADIASKGGNFLLNVGPTAEGLFPQASVERLAVMGRWMKANGDAIHGTSASPFRSLPWGRCTQRATPEGATLYLHVFDWPQDGKLRVPGLFNQVRGAYLLADASRTPLTTVRQEDAVVVSLPPAAPDSLNSVVVLELKGKADVNDPPKIDTTYTVFIDQISVGVTTDRENVVIRYTTDGSTPTASSSVLTGPVTLKASSTVRARAFRGDFPRQRRLGSPVHQSGPAAFGPGGSAAGTPLRIRGRRLGSSARLFSPCAEGRRRPAGAHARSHEGARVLRGRLLGVYQRSGGGRLLLLPRLRRRKPDDGRRTTPHRQRRPSRAGAEAGGRGPGEGTPSCQDRVLQQDGW